MPTAIDLEKSAPIKVRRVYRRASERRAEIIAAAQAIFIRSSFGGARTRDIAEAAGVNQATLFKHFSTKERLFEEAVIQPLVDALRKMHGSVDVYQTAATADELAKLGEASTLRHLEDMEQMLPLLSAALFSDLDLGRRLYCEHLEPLIRQRGEVLRPLVRDGIDPEFVGLSAFGMLFAVAMQRWLGGRNDDLMETAMQFNRLSTGGFARAGRTNNNSDGKG